jgi:hypothetical protein
MNDTPFARGGFIPGGTSDMVPALIRPGEPVMTLEAAREWLASGLSLEDWMAQRKADQEDTDGDADQL